MDAPLMHLGGGDIGFNSGSRGGEEQIECLWRALPKSPLATCAATGGGERSSEAGENEVKRAARDYVEEDEGDCGSEPLDALP